MDTQCLAKAQPRLLLSHRDLQNKQPRRERELYTDQEGDTEASHTHLPEDDGIRLAQSLSGKGCSEGC